MAVSVLANCAMEKQSRTEIKRLNGEAHLCNLLASLADTSILSRVTRALANLSQDLTIANDILNLDTVLKLIGILKDSTDVHLLQNTLRALRIVGRSELCVKKLADCNGILSFIELLRNENGNDIKCSCLQTLLGLIKRGNRVLGEQLQENDGIEVISQLSYSDDKDIAESCINILCTITGHSSVRVSVGTMGGIEAFIHHIRACGSLLLPSVEGICMCCREAVNRNKIRSCGGLEVLLGLLRRSEYSQIFDKILCAFVCFTYDELALKRLLSCGLIPTLLPILQQLLFPNNAIKVTSEKQDDELLTSTGINIAAPTQRRKTASMPSETALHPSPSGISQGNASRTSDSAESVMLPLATLPSTSYTASSSPPYSLSPNLSPELRVSYMSPCSPQSVRSSSPDVFSPSGSEVDDFSSECSDGDDEPGTMQQDERPNAEIFQNFSPAGRGDLTASDCNVMTTLKEVASTSREGATSTKDLTATHGNMLRTLMEDLTTTHSGSIETASEKECDETDKQGYDFQSSQDERGLFPRRTSDVGSQSQRVPLLPGSSFNEHIHLFLPNENLFSADQPSPRKVQPLPSRMSIGRMSSDALRGTSSSSQGLSKKLHETSKTPDSSSQSLSYPNSLHGVDRKIIFLLSRFGQMPDATDAEALTSPECIQTLLDYLCYGKNPDSRCVRLLNRIALDRKYFETLVIIMFPGAIYKQLVCGSRSSYLLRSRLRSRAGAEFDSSMKESSVFTSEPTKATTDNDRSDISSNQPSGEVALACGSLAIVESLYLKAKLSDHKFTATPTHVSNLDFNDPAALHHSAPQKAFTPDHNVTQPDTVSTAESFSPSLTKEIGLSLLSILTTQACSSFGEGILAHLLLRGTEKQKEACALSLPYLCKSFRVKRKLLVDYKGVLVILSILCNSTEKADIIRAVDSLTFLVSNSALKMDKDFELLIGSKSTNEPSSPGKEESHVLTLRSLVSTNSQKSNGSSTPIMDNKNGTDIASEGIRNAEGFPAVADNDLSIRHTLTGACRDTECVAKGNDRSVDTSTTSEGQQKADCSSKTMPGVYQKGNCMRSLDKVDDVAGNTGQMSESYVMDQDGSGSGTVTKRLREAEKTDNNSNKKTKVESSPTQLGTCSINCFYNMTHSTPFDVVLKVENGGTIKVHRSVLNAFSEVFSAMLSGDFVEAKQSEIIVKDLSYSTVSFLVHYAYGCSLSFDSDNVNRVNCQSCPSFVEYLSVERIPSDYFNFDFDFLLDLLASADRFLLTDLKNQCVQLTMYSVTGERVVEAYLAAAFYRTSRLRIYCLQYIFLGNLDPSCVYQCVVNLLESKERDRVFEDFKNIALDCCN